MAMLIRRFAVSAILVGLVVGCRGNDRAGRSNASGSKVYNGSDSGARVAWFANTAPLLLVPNHASDRALLVFADTTVDQATDVPGDSTARLLRLDGTADTARLAVLQSAEGCTESSLDPSPARNWGAGFVDGKPTSLAADSLRAMSRADSSALTRAAYRLASTIPNGPGSRFGGLPFVAVDLWRLKLADGKTAVVASLRRQLNQEDSPLEERTFLVAESDATATDGYSLVYSERASGAEETVESRELLAAVVFPGATAVELVVSHDFGDETSFAIVERTAAQRWHERWVSRRFSC
jgi:hypothetical protein